MKNIFIFIMFILFGNVGLFGVDVHCNKSGEIIEDGKIIKEGKSYLKEGNTYILGDFKNDKNADGTSKEEIVEVPDGNTHTYELYATNIDANFIINDWDQTSIRIKAKVKSKIAVKITEVVHLPGTWLTVDNSFVHYRFLDPAYAGETRVMDQAVAGNSLVVKRNYGGICYQKRLDQFDPSAGNLYSGTKDKDEFFTVADEGETVNVLFEIDQTLVKSTLITVSTSIFRFKATITVTPIAPSSVDSSTKLMIVNDQYNVKAPGAVDASGNFTGDTNLYTQIVGKPFDVRVISTINAVNIKKFYYAGLFSELDNGKIVPIDCTYLSLYMATSPYNGCKKEMDDLTLYFKFASALASMQGASPTNPISYNLDNFTIPTDRTDINYNKLFFEIQGYYDIANRNVKVRSNYFSARPAKIVLETKDLKNELFGGKEYNSFDSTITNEIYTKLTALDDSGKNAAASYNAKFISKSMISLDKSAGGSKDPKKWCSYDGSEDDDKRLLNVPMVTTAKFDKGIGKVYTNYDATNNKYYIKYPDIGHTKIYILDDDTTMIDQVNGDCIKGSTSNDKVNGKIGCNVALEANYFKFKPSSFQITRKELKNGYISDDGNITFFSFGKDYGMLVDGDNPNYTDFMGGKLELDIQARLADNTVPNLYSKNCYVNDVNINFELDKTADEKKALEDAKNNVSFYGIKDRTLGLDQNETYLIKIENLDTNGVLKNDGKFKLAKNSFYAGESNVSLKINFDREYNVAKDPIRIKSSDFKINGQDTIYTSVVINDKVIAVDDDRVVDYFYGRVYSDRLEENMEEIEGESCDVDIYYGVYCGDECQAKQGANEKYEFIKDTINTTDDKKDLDYARISDLNYYKVKHFNKLRSDEFAELLWKSQVDGLNLKIYNRNSPKVEDSFGSIEASEWKMGLWYHENDPENIFTISIKTPNYMKYDKNYIGGDPKDSSFKVKFIRDSNSNWVGSGKQGDVMGIDEDDKLIKSKKGRIDW